LTTIHYLASLSLSWPTQTIQMKTQEQFQNTFQKIAEFLPLVLITLGLAFDWLKVPYAGLILILGFLLYGVFGVIISVKRKYYKGISIRFFKLVNDIAIILLTVAFFYGESTLFYLFMLILLDRLILIPRVDRN